MVFGQSNPLSLSHPRHYSSLIVWSGQCKGHSGRLKEWKVMSADVRTHGWCWKVGQGGDGLPLSETISSSSTTPIPRSWVRMMPSTSSIAPRWPTRTGAGTSTRSQNRTEQIKITTEQNRTESKLFSVSEVVKTTLIKLSTGVGVGSIQLVGCHGQEEGDNPALTHPRVISVNTP